MRFTALFVSLLLAVPPAAAQQPSPADPTIRTSSQEVLLDIIVRDKKGRPVRDLNQDEIEVSDEGSQQRIRSFRLVTGKDAAGPEEAPKGGDRKAPAAAAAAVNPLRQIRLVTLAFEKLGPESRNLSRAAATDLLKNESGGNLFFGVFTIDQRLSVLQQYTSDKELVKTAVSKATSSSYSMYTSESDKIANELKAVTLQNQASFTPSSGQAAASEGGAAAAAAMAQMTLNMLQFSQAMERTQQGRTSIFALLSLIKEQYRLPGRKTILYFTEGLYVPPELQDQFRSIIGIANRSNVSVYAIDAKGLVTYNQNSAGGSMMQQATASLRSQQTVRGGPVTADQAKALDIAEDSTRSNATNALADLSESTGGFLITNSNDLRNPLRRVSEDIDTYYELSYTPQIDKFDGSFRKINVKIARSDIRIQTRAGYFALPPIEGQNLLPYEVPMLTALSLTPMPRKLPYRSSALRFRAANGSPSTALVIDVPMNEITFAKETPNFRTHFSVLALVKDSTGAVVQKLSRDFPIQGSVENLDATKAGHFIFTQHVDLAPGRYTLETAVLDREAAKVGAKKQSIIVVEPSRDLGMSSLALVRSVGAAAQPVDPEDPFQFTGGKVTPSLDDTVKGGQGANLSLYFTAYLGRPVLPTANAQPETAKLTLEFLQDGKAVARAEQLLPQADDAGRVKYIAQMPIGTLQAGQYEMRATVSHSGKAVQDRMMVNIE